MMTRIATASYWRDIGPRIPCTVRGPMLLTPPTMPDPDPADDPI